MKNFPELRNLVLLGVPAVAGLATVVPAFAVGESSVAITSEMLSPITDAVIANIGVILPIGIAIFGILIGVSLIPTLVKKFARG